MLASWNKLSSDYKPKAILCFYDFTFFMFCLLDVGEQSLWESWTFKCDGSNEKHRLKLVFTFDPRAESS